jgi:uncharacterized membrane protein YfcA
MELWQLIVLAVVGLGASILSGVAGAGGGFIMTPLMIALGLTPAQAVSTGKISGFSVTVGALNGLRKSTSKVAKGKIAAIMLLAFLIGLVSPFAIKSLDNETYRITLGFILLFLIPVVIIRRTGHRSYRPTAKQKTLGGVLLALSLLLQGIFSGGLGTLVNLVLMSLLGMDATEANITKRWSQLILNATIVLGVIGSGLIMWQVVAIMIPVTLVGGYMGGHMAVRRGNVFVMRITIGLMFISALYLIIGS